VLGSNIASTPPGPGTVAPSSTLAFTGPGTTIRLLIAAAVFLLLGMTLLIWTKRSA
jgi:hypothetical protein